MTTAQTPPAQKPEEKKENKPVPDGLKNSQQELKHAMLMIQTSSNVGKEQVTGALTRKFPHLTGETAGRLYEQASRQLVIDKDERNAEHFIEHCMGEGTHPEIHSLMTLFPRRFPTIDSAKEFQERMLKKYANNHKLPKAETIPATPTASATSNATKINGSKIPPPVLSKSQSSTPQNMSGSKTQPPPNITASSTTQVVKPEIVPRGTIPSGKVIRDAGEPVRNPLWRNFDVYSDDSRTEEILLENVVTQTFSPRQQIDDDYIRKLGESLRDDGQERAILVTPREGKLLCVSGDCRIEAARKVGLTKLRGLVVHLTDEQAIALGLAANLEHDLPHRPLTEIEEAKVLKKLTSDPYNWTQERAAEFFGRKAHTWVIKRLNLLRAPEGVKTGIEDGSLTERHARALSGLPDSIQEQAVGKIAEKGLSVRQTENLARDIKAHPAPETLTPTDIDAMLARKREETLAQNHEAILRSPTKPLETILTEIGAVRIHKDDNGIYFFTNTCPVCRNEHTININFEQGFAQIPKPKPAIIGGKAS